MAVIDVNGVALNYREMGSRDQRTIVFTHLVGLWDSQVFDHLVSELDGDFHIVTVDQHGHGGIVNLTMPRCCGSARAA